MFVVVVLLITAVLLVRIPSIQNRIAQKAITYLEEQIGTNVELKSITIDFPKKIVIEGLFLEDLEKDTLLYAGRIGVDAAMLRLLSNEISLSQIEIENAVINIKRADSAFNFDFIIDSFADTTTTVADTTSSTPWVFSLGDIEISNLKASYDDSVHASALIGSLNIATDDIDFDKLTFDFDEIEITNTNLRYDTLQVNNLNFLASDIKADTTGGEADIEAFSFQEKHGELKKLSGFAKFNSSGAELRSIEILYGQSELAIDGRVTFPDTTGDITISKSRIAVSDLLAFQPSLLDSLPVSVPTNAVILVDTKAHGNLADFGIEFLELKTLDSTSISMSGNIKNSVLDLNLKEFYTTMSDVKLIVADTLFPDSIQLPKWVRLNGNVTGSINQPAIASTITTDEGVIIVDGQLDIDKKKYKAKIKADSIQAGRIANQSTLGNVSFDLAVDGSGFSMDELHTKVDLLVRDFTYNEYTFRDFKVDGTIDKFLFSGKATLNDENLAFELNADVDYNGDIPVYKAEFDLKNLDLGNLKLSEMPLKARLTVDVDLTTNDFKIMNGRLDIRKVAVFNGDKLYSVDSMLFASLDQEGHSKMSIRSDILTGDFEGTFNIFSISEVLQAHFERYFSDGKNEAKPEGPPQNFTFDLKIKNTDLLTEVLFPKLEPFTPGVIRGEFDSEEHKLGLVFRMPKMQYDDISVDSLVILVDSDPEELRFFTKLDQVAADTITIHQVNLTGAVANDSIRIAFNVLDSLEEKKYSIGANVKRDGKMMRVHLDPKIILNSSPWDVPAANFLSFGDGVIIANQLEIQKNGQKVLMIGDTRNDPAVTIRFEDMELGNLTRVISGVVPASGELNGDFKFTTKSGGNFSSKLTITSMTLLQKPLGDLTLTVDHAQTQYNLSMLLRGNQTTVETKGTYGGPKGQETIDITADIQQLNMEAVQAFSMGQITNAQGLLKGKVAVKGKPTKPDITGNLTFSGVSVVPTYLNSAFELREETITLRNDNIELKNFTIRDGEGNEAKLKGNINIADYTNPAFDLTLIAKDFQVLNTQAGDNELFYGKVKINSTARISGSANQPKADFKLSFTDDTNFTYIVPSSEKGVLSAKGIVNFVDRDAANDPFLAEVAAKDSIRTTYAGMEVSAVIDLRDKEILNIVIDPITGDRLTVQGNSSLTFEMTQSGNMNLSGRYEITKGSYNFSFYNLVKRKFDIEKGSTITWSGDPLNATMDIRASNLVETSPIDLLATQASATNTESATDFNQRLPFLVYLNIKGQLLTPQISFTLDMPADKRNAYGGMLYSKIQDINSRESDLNKQVFALLILKRFVADNPLESQAGGISNTARTSVSRVLSEQLNRLSQNVKGIQLSVDIKSYETASESGAEGRTRAQLGLSKSLFGDRLVVKLSGNVDIEGENAGSSDVTDYIGDLALEYKMTQDGRFRVTGFRNSNYDMIDGELTETGAGLIYIKDYNTLRELFKANEKELP